jgi:cysteine desulfurase/selenocysteine lyase
VTLDSVIWADSPDRDEAGSPNVVGVVGLLAAIQELQSIGMDWVAEHERQLTCYALKKMCGIPNIQVFGCRQADRAIHRVGVIPFLFSNLPSPKVAAILGYEFGIGVRSGCFCAHPLVAKLVTSSSNPDSFGFLRASFGIYNTEKDVDTLVAALEAIQRGDYKGDYVVHNDGSFKPKGFEWDYEKFISN